MSGGTRCNLTQNTDTRGIISEFGPNGRFLHSALAAFSNEDLVTYFNQRGLPLKLKKRVRSSKVTEPKMYLMLPRRRRTASGLLKSSRTRRTSGA